ncbi:hypothetical protein RHOER0001_5074 [Rhodococcus erythropolis SK121]|nr:hypothetical protein RHOER0001_5074 [Rhodococcus erythropolis SK121]
MLEALGQPLSGKTHGYCSLSSSAEPTRWSGSGGFRRGTGFSASPNEFGSAADLFQVTLRSLDFMSQVQL